MLQFLFGSKCLYAAGNSGPRVTQLKKAVFLFIACSVLSSLGHCSTLPLKGRAWEATGRQIDCPLKSSPFNGYPGGPAAPMDRSCPADSWTEVDLCCRGLYQHLGRPDKWRTRGGWPHRQGTWFYQPRQCKFFSSYISHLILLRSAYSVYWLSFILNTYPYHFTLSNIHIHLWLLEFVT